MGIIPIQEWSPLPPNKGKIRIMSTTLKTFGAWRILSSSALLGKRLYQNLQCHEENRRTPYKRSVEQIIRIMLEEVVEILGHRVEESTSRMNERFTIPHAEDPSFVLGMIARGGIRPTIVAEKFFEDEFDVDVPILYAGSQRVGNREDMSAEVTTKGRCDFAGRNLLILESALATGTTIARSVESWFRDGEGRPRSIVIGAIHTSRESIELVQSKLARFEIPIHIVAALEHNGMDQRGYLVGPGCGDVGAKDVGLPDK